MNRTVRAMPALIAACVLAVTTACGAQVAPGTQTGPAPVTIENCGQRITYPMPQRPVAYDMSSTEKMFALGLAGRMRGMVMPRTAAPAVDRSPYVADYRAVETLSTDVLGFETVVGAKADWVLAGWNAGFSESRGITPKKLEGVGIRSFQHTETCFNYGDRPVRVPPLEAMYTDLQQLGQIFHVEDRANTVVTGLRARASALTQKRPSGEPARVFVYDSGTDKPYTSGAQAAPSAIVSLAGGRNIADNVDQRWTTIGWEAVVAAQPEVITVVDYGDKPVADKIAFLKSFPPLAATPAVRDNRFHILDYGEAVSGPRNIDAAEKLAGYLRSVGR